MKCPTAGVVPMDWRRRVALEKECGMRTRITRLILISVMLTLAWRGSSRGAEIILGDWSVSTHRAVVNVFWRDFEIIRTDNCDSSLDCTNPSARYQLTGTNNTSAEVIKKKDGVQIITMTKREVKAGINFARVLAIQKDRLKLDYTFTVTGATGTNQYNRMALFIPSETFQPEGQTAAVVSDGHSAELKLPPLETRSDALILSYWVDSLSWVTDGVKFRIDLTPPRIGAQAPLAHWILVDYRKAGAGQGQPLFSLYFNAVFHTGDIVTFGCEIQAERVNLPK